MRYGAPRPGTCATSTSPWSTMTSTSTIMPRTFGLGLDPSTRKRDRNTSLYGTGKWNRMLIDATINLDHDPDPELGGARFPPTAWPDKADVDAVKARWSELGFDRTSR